ncbi:MAG: hypothetical protein J2P48_10555, partial [Alphaproteobacteria bacterium]|nr:hypothetical protein [Alphaproteobacteria bacterium]
QGEVGKFTGGRQYRIFARRPTNPLRSFRHGEFATERETRAPQVRTPAASGAPRRAAMASHVAPAP